MATRKKTKKKVMKKAAPRKAAPPAQPPEIPRFEMSINGRAYWFELSTFMPIFDLAVQTLDNEGLRTYLARYSVKLTAWKAATGYEQVVLTDDKGTVLGDWLD